MRGNTTICTLLIPMYFSREDLQTICFILLICKSKESSELLGPGPKIQRQFAVSRVWGDTSAEYIVARQVYISKATYYSLADALTFVHRDLQLHIALGVFLLDNRPTLSYPQ